MKDFKNVVILCGAQSGEREISIKSAQPVFDVLKNLYPTRLIQLEENKLPDDLNPASDLIFPLTHGDFGEDGQLQKLLEQNHFSYLGSDSVSSALCIDKIRSKHLARRIGLPTLPCVALFPGQMLTEYALTAALKTSSFVLKPTNKGSSIGVHICHTFHDLLSIWEKISTGTWMVEPYVQGRELTLGVLQGKALGVVEICPKTGFYDFKNKYTAGACEYIYPADISAEILQKMQSIAVEFFKYANCLDFGRIDCILTPDDQVWFLEMNTIPGMTDQSLFPKSAACVGISFESLLKRLIEGALKRFK